MSDIIEKIGFGTIIQHGELNDRIYVMKLHKKDFPDILERIINLADEYLYSKIFCKVPSWAAPVFYSNGFILEALIPRFYGNKEDVFFMSKFLNPHRFQNPEQEMLDQLANLLVNKSDNNSIHEKPESYNILKLNMKNADSIASLYKKVFDSYPFPIFDPEYILKTMNENIQYFGIEKNGELIALSSAEIDKTGQNAEMTDFATLPDFRGQKLASILLSKMEVEMLSQGITTLYTIARLNSMAMNKTFLNQDYTYAGTLIKNTNISGKIESMNVYYKHLDVLGN
ncbi:MAG: putative beta-lysine N-acetyltransferase [Paludibacter sp.]|nr:putative beta-lysine N-acetyltransferase [Paludibacter sp.]